MAEKCYRKSTENPMGFQLLTINLILYCQRGLPNKLFTVRYTTFSVSGLPAITSSIPYHNIVFWAARIYNIHVLVNDHI